jgi:hypothetical protein
MPSLLELAPARRLLVAETKFAVDTPAHRRPALERTLAPSLNAERLVEHDAVTPTLDWADRPYL